MTLRLDIVAKAWSLMAARGGIDTINTFQELQNLAQEILEGCLTWDKFARPGGLRSCPILASADISVLHGSPTVEPIVDVEHCFKKVKGVSRVDQPVGSPGNQESGSLEQSNPEQANPQHSSGAQQGKDVYLEYKKGG